MLNLSEATVVDFPLRGEWVALNTPAARVPSHGTDFFGQRYAIDLARLGSDGTKFHSASPWQHLFGVVPAAKFLGWDEPISAAFPGRVVRVGEGWPDRTRVNALWELVRTSFSQPGPAGGDYRPLVGNFVIVEGDAAVAMYAHLRRGSARVGEGDLVKSRQILGAVGNSGNSTMPHLHFLSLLPRATEARLFSPFESQNPAGPSASRRP